MRFPHHIDYSWLLITHSVLVFKTDREPLAEGYNTYSPQAVKRLFDGKKVSPFLDFNINELKQSDVIVRAMQRISVSGVQEKFSGLIDQHGIRIAESNERSTYILKPAPWDETIATRKQIPANEHVTMQIAYLQTSKRATYLTGLAIRAA